MNEGRIYIFGRILSMKLLYCNIYIQVLCTKVSIEQMPLHPFGHFHTRYRYRYRTLKSFQSKPKIEIETETENQIEINKT